VRLGDRIAIVRAHPGLGDMLCAIPALRAIRGTAPRAHITLIALQSAGWIPERFHTYVNELLPFPGFPGLPGPEFDARATVRFLAEAQEREFDVAIQLQGSGVASNVFTELLGARSTAGTVLPGQPKPDDQLFVELRVAEPEAQRLLRVVENLGASPTRDAELEFVVTQDDEAEVAEHDLAPLGYVCLHPGDWDTEHVAAVADALADRGLQPVFTGGATDAIIAAMSADALDLTRALSVGATAAAMRDAALTVCDPSVSQLAEAVGAASVIVFPRDGDVARWGPLSRERHHVLGGPEHDDEVTVDEVLDAADALLGPAPARQSRA
jgi:ADP-heptose:LPS heptosyltransferase